METEVKQKCFDANEASALGNDCAEGLGAGGGQDTPRAAPLRFALWTQNYSSLGGWTACAA